MGKFLFLFLFLFLLSFVGAYTVVCEDESKGFQIWDYNQTYNETGWTIEQMEEDEGMNCTLIESPIAEEICKEFEPIINQLNQRLKENYIQIQAQEKQVGIFKIFSLIFVIVSVTLVIYMWVIRII